MTVKWQFSGGSDAEMCQVNSSKKWAGLDYKKINMGRLIIKEKENGQGKNNKTGFRLFSNETLILKLFSAALITSKLISVRLTF